MVIIGAGPAGLAAAIYTGRGRLDTLVLEKGIPGGQILLTDWVENYPGFPEGITPIEMMENFRKQASRFGARFQTDEARGIESRDGHWVVKGIKEEYSTRTVIVATGSNYRKLGVEGEERLTGKGVSYCATCDGAFFKDKEVAVVGGGDWALTEAQFLTKFCKKVRIIHRRDKFRGEKILQERVFANRKIEVIWDTVVIRIIGDQRIEALGLKDVKTGSASEIEVDGFFISIGMIPNSDFIKDTVEVDEWKQIRVQKNMTTSQPGVYAAGDVTDACPNQMATAAGTGVHAAIAVEEYLSQY